MKVQPLWLHFFYFYTCMTHQSNEIEPILLSTAYFPPIAYFAILAGACKVVVESQETYPKQTFRNRCTIHSANGPLTLSLPVTRPHGNHTVVTDVGIATGVSWQLQHWRAIESAYNPSPFFLYYKEEIKPFFSANAGGNLFTHNLEIIKSLCEITGIETDIAYNESYEKNPSRCVDLRYLTSRKQSVEKPMPEYPQVFQERNGFIPNLSILDLLFNLGPDTKDYLKKVSVRMI